jgi:RNA polymerase sigma-70 factor, ECF subfamily
MAVLVFPVATPQASLELEAALIARVCEGEKEAFYELVRPYEKALYVAARSVLGNDEEAEDAAQEAVLKAFVNLRDFRAESKFSTWLIQIAINEARMRLRKQHRELYEAMEQSGAEGDYTPRDFADWREIPEETLHRKQLREALTKAIAALETKYREVFVLRDVQHMSIAETARMLGITAANVKTRLLRARLQLRDALAPGLDGGWALPEARYKKVRPW